MPVDSHPFKLLTGPGVERLCRSRPINVLITTASVMINDAITISTLRFCLAGFTLLVAWCSSNVMCRINEVTLCWAWLVLGWVAVCT